MKKINKGSALIFAIALFLQSTLGVYAGIGITTTIASAATYGRGITVSLDELKKGDLLERGVILNGSTKNENTIYIDGEQVSDITTEPEEPVFFPAEYEIQDLLVTDIVKKDDSLSVWFERQDSEKQADKGSDDRTDEKAGAKADAETAAETDEGTDGEADEVTDTEAAPEEAGTDLPALVASEDKIKLESPVTLEQCIVIEGGRTVTIDLNGFDIQRVGAADNSSDGGVFEVRGSSTLIIENSGDDLTGMITGGHAAYGGAVKVTDGSKLVMKGGQLSLNFATYGGAISLTEGSKATLEGVTLSGNNNDTTASYTPGTDSRGGGIYVGEGCTCDIKDSTIDSNAAAEGGAICNLGTLEVNGSTIKGNLATAGNGAGISNAAELTVKNTRIVSNNGAVCGGGIYNTKTMYVEDCTISGNSSSKNGGGISDEAASSDAKTVYSGDNTISDNSSGIGGGIYASGLSDGSVIKKIKFTGNCADGNGGALYVETGIRGMSLTDITMESNYATSDGGAIYTSSDISLDDCMIRLNESKGKGGGIFLNSAILTVSSTSISENTSTGDGAGVWVGGAADNYRVILAGGQTIIYMNKKAADSGNEITDSNLVFETFKEIRVTGEFKGDSKIGVLYTDTFKKRTITRDYGDHNSRPIDTYFMCDSPQYKVKQDDDLTEVLIIKRARPSASGYKLRVQIIVTNDADKWFESFVYFYAKKNNGLGEEYMVKESENIQDKIDHESKNGEVNYDSGEIDCGDSFPSKINVFANFNYSIFSKRDWGATVKVWINGVNCATTEVYRNIRGNAKDNGNADNWISIGEDKYPYIDDADIEQEKSIDLDNDDTKKVSLTLVDQYGVEFKAPGKDYFEIENQSFPGEDTYKSLDNAGLEWKFDSSKTDQCHNSVYNIRFKSGSNVRPWVEIPVMVRFKVPLYLTLRIGNKTSGYKEIETKKGYQGDYISIEEPASEEGYRVKSVSKSGVCIFQKNEKGTAYDFTYVTENVTLTFETAFITYRIAYDKNAPSGENVTGRMVTKTYTYDDLVVLARNQYVCKGYEFAGWNREPDGSGDSYEDLAKVRNLTTKQGEMVTLYAQWKRESLENLTASIFSEGSIAFWIGIMLASGLIIMVGCMVSVRNRR